MPLIRSVRANSGIVPLWAHVLLVSALAIGFNVYLRSFPLLSEDGAFNYMALLQRLNTEEPLSLLFGFKLIDGLGQPNPFLTMMFDPFSWPMLLVRFGRETPHNYVIAFQLTMALRVVVCWLGTYVFASAAFPGSRTIAASASYLNVFLSFFLSTTFGGTESHAAMYNASQTALLPLVVGVYLRSIVLGKPLVSIYGLVTFILLCFLILSYPIGSLVTLAVIIGIAATIPVVGGAAIRRSASVHLVGLLAAIATIMFLPGLDVYASWQSLAGASSRVVFADELRTYFGGYNPPTYWFAPPFASRLVVLCAVAGLLVVDRVPPLARSIMVTLTLMVAFTQLVGLASTLEVFADLARPLPPIGRVERFFPPFYAFSAAVALYAGERALVADGARRLPLWSAAAIVLSVAVVYMFAGAYDKFAWSGLSRSRTSDLVIAVVLALVVLAFVLNALRSFAPRHLPAFLRQPAGPIEAGPGRAQLARVALCYGFVAVVAIYAVHMWRDKAYFIAAYLSRSVLCDRVTMLGCRDTDFGRGMNAGTNPIVDFLQSRLTASELFAGRAEYLSPYDPARPETADMAGERTRNSLETGNGFMLASLSFHGIPVASTYEQSHDYLYYLFWTRYLTQNSRVHFMPNWTALYQFLPGRLALAGVRYVIARRELEPALGSTPIAFRWRDFVVAELADANTRGYGATRIVTAKTIADALLAMRRVGFDPRTEAVLSEADRQRIPEGELEPVAASEITTRRQTVHLTARSAGKASLIVLPFRFSHCWQARWQGPSGTLLRADEALLAVYFEGAIDVRLAWEGGYGSRARCLEEDASLIAEAQAAARQIPY